MSEKRRVRRARIVHALRKTPPKALAPPDSYDPVEVAAMLREVGIALVEVAQPTPIVEARLLQIAAKYTTEPVRVVVLPTVLMIQIGESACEFVGSTHSSLQLDAAGRVDQIAALAEAGAITPTDALEAVDAARTMPPRFGRVSTVLGYALTTLGFGIMINPTWASLPGYVFLGLVVGTIVTFGGPFPSLAPILPTLSALVVTLLATWFVADAANDGLLRVISPALVATLPGMSLTTGAMELAGSQIISGASRLMYGVSQLALLVFGVIMGMHIAGAEVTPQALSSQMGSWSLYLSIVVVALGLRVYLSAPKGSLFWLMAAIAVAILGQKLAETFLSPAHSGFVGAILAVVFAMLATRVRTAPPGVVMLLAAFWSLVPGATSFMSVSQAATGGNADVASVGVAGAAIAAIALGTLVGWSIFRTIDSHTAWAKAIAGGP
ncbi:MAG: threonine/serine exporter family protein [Mycobacterium sp.]|nr:threonine/serine exporter family protein [Mycobacterium sp.]